MTENETKQAADETKQAEVKENASDVKEKHDWVKEAYECFIKNAVDLEPTDPAGAVWEYFKKNATDELKAKVEAEGKTGASCWKFIKEVARKALGGRSGHIDPVAVYAIAMHYFQDVPKDWDKVEKPARREAASVKTGKGKDKRRKTAEAKAKELDAKAVARAKKIAHKNRVELAKELGDKEFAAKVEAEGRELTEADTKKPDAKKKAKKRGCEQGFFFDLMETPTVGPDAAHGSAAGQDVKHDVASDAALDRKGAGDAE